MTTKTLERLSPFFVNFNSALTKTAAIAFISFALIGCGGGGGGNEEYRETEVKFKVIAAGHHYYSLALSKGGKVYAAGRNNGGQLGLGDNNSRVIFTEVTSLNGKNIIAVSAGVGHSLALSSNGKVYAAGNNGDGQLGLGDNNDRATFTEVTSLNGKNITAVAAGAYHTIALDDSGKVYAAGFNLYGQLGFGDNNNRAVFTEVTGLGAITAISAGDDHSLALDDNGKGYATGRNNFGQLGTGSIYDQNVFTAFNGLINNQNITAVAAGAYHTIALDDSGTVYTVGSGEYGRLGKGNTEIYHSFLQGGIGVKGLDDKNITAVSAGDDHSLALDDNGKIYAAGRNGSGQIGLGGDITPRHNFTAVTTGLDDKNITAISAGNHHSFALDDNGKIYATGNNAYGQLGLGDNDSRVIFTEVSVFGN
ncbi:MAG: hypothetical protein LBF86_01385 [Helicobacteraceae bacterium]|nr:hypothetical protein [Helicobacteraceae bacterium]